MAFEKTSSGYEGKKKPKKARKKKVAGPYRSQSSNKKIREKATKHEHRKVARKVSPSKTGPSGWAPPSPVEEADRKAQRVLRRGLRSAPDRVDPGREYFRAKYEGREPSSDLRNKYPRAYDKAMEAFGDYHAPREGLKEDPIAEAAIGLVGGPASLGAKLGAKALKAGAGRLAGEGGEKALKAAAKRAGDKAKAAPAKKAARARSAPKRAVRRAKETPKRVRSAPRRAKKAASTKEGRRAATKGAGRKTARHPVASFAGAGVVSNQAALDVPVLREAGALVEGHVNALRENPGETLKTTGRAIPGIITGPAALLGAAGSSAVHGTSEPLEREARKQVSGLVDVGERMLSGDPETVQKSVEDEVGLSVVAPLPALSRVRNTRPYKQVRRNLRGKVAVKRQGTRAKRRGELREAKAGQRSKAKKIRHAVLDTATGEERILRRTGKVIEGRRQRKAVSRAAARRKAEGERAATLASRDVIKEIRRSKLAKGRGHNIGDAVATVAQYGISRDREKAMRQLDEIEASIGRVDPDSLPAETVTDLANIRFLRETPEAFTDKHFWKAIDAYKKQAREIETSGRKKVLAVGDVYGIARPEERLEAGVTVGGRRVRADFHKQPETLQRKQAELADLRKDATLAETGAMLAKGDDKARYGRVAAEIRAKAKQLERELKDYRAGFKVAQKDYVREAQATIREKGLEQPAYVKDVKPRQGLEPLPSFPGGRSARKQHMAGIEQSRRGVTMARDFETLVDQSIAEPRMRRAMHEATTEFAESYAVPVAGKRYLTSEEINRAINRGELDEGQYAVLHSQFFKQAILDPHKRSEDLSGDVRAALETPISAEIMRRANDPGNKYVVIPKEALREFIHQMEPPKGIDKIFGGLNRGFTRVILGYSPGWAVAQLVAEGIPAALSIGANPARWARVVKYLAKEDKRLGPKDRAAIDAMAGESPGVTPHPQIQFKPDTNMQASRFFRLSNRNPVGRALLKGAKGEALGVFDRWKGGKYRKAVAAAKADRELNSFVASLSGLMRGQRSIVEAIKGKPLKAQMEYIAKHPAEAAKLEGYLDNVMGNWRALTRHEAKLAPLVVFYPFVRYSLRWMFWSFPKEHPAKASILYFLSQQNAEELEKLTGGPVDFLQYTVPVYSSAKGGEGVLPGGSRIAPGTNAITQSIGKGQVEGLVSALNPVAGMGVTAVTGVSPLSGEKEAHSPAEHGLLALNQLLSLPAPFRLAGVNDLTKGEPSGVSKAFDRMDPNRDERSVLFPFLPQSGERFRDAAKLGRALDKSGFDPELGDDLISAALDAVKRGDLALAKRLQKRRERSDKASGEIGALVREYIGKEGELPDLTDQQYEWLGKITGKRVFPYEEPEPEPFGLPSTDPAELREQFGLPSTSTADLRKQFGIE